MAFNQDIEDKIKAFVYRRPRNINEVALLLGINWRTADRYVGLVAERTGLIETHTFRQGGRSSMKIAFWSNRESIYSTQVQEKLFAEIERGIDKEDFSPMEIFQYVNQEKAHAYYEKAFPYYDFHVESLFRLLSKAEKEVCIFCGNVAWINFEFEKKSILNFIKSELLDRGVKLKIITNMNLVDLDNIRLLLSLNHNYDEEMIEIKHEITPLRCFIIDDKKAKFSEIQKVGKRPGMKKDDLGIYYEIWDEGWISWLKQVFWKRFQNAVPASKRIPIIEKIQFMTRPVPEYVEEMIKKNLE